MYIQKSALRWAMLCLCAAATGCSNLLLIQVTPVAKMNDPQVQSSHTYEQSRGALKRVVVYAERCSRANAGGSGVQVGRSELLTFCGVQLARLEVALTAQRFEVINGKALYELMDRERLTATEAARGLGVHAIIQVNDMDRKLDPDVTFDFLFQKSNSHEEALGPRPPEDRDEKQDYHNLRLALMKNYQEVLKNYTSCGATLNLSVVLVETEQSIWFYRGGNYANFVPATALAEHRDGHWQLRLPGQRRAPEPEETLKGFLLLPPVPVCNSGELERQLHTVATDMARRLAGGAS